MFNPLRSQNNINKRKSFKDYPSKINYYTSIDSVSINSNWHDTDTNRDYIFYRSETLSDDVIHTAVEKKVDNWTEFVDKVDSTILLYDGNEKLLRKTQFKYEYYGNDTLDCYLEGTMDTFVYQGERIQKIINYNFFGWGDCEMKYDSFDFNYYHEYIFHYRNDTPVLKEYYWNGEKKELLKSDTFIYSKDDFDTIITRMPDYNIIQLVKWFEFNKNNVDSSLFSERYIIDSIYVSPIGYQYKTTFHYKNEYNPEGRLTKKEFHEYDYSWIDEGEKIINSTIRNYQYLYDNQNQLALMQIDEYTEKNYYSVNDSILDYVYYGNYPELFEFVDYRSPRKLSNDKIPNLNRINHFPNPVSDKLFIESNGEIEVVIFSTDGRRMYSTSIKGNSTINVSHLENGIYFIHMITKDGKLLKHSKIMKQ